MRDPAWYASPSVLTKRPLEFFPSRGMSPAERLNAMVRFAGYAAALLAIYRRNWSPVLLGVLLVAVISAFYRVEPNSPQIEVEPMCTLPTPNNPFMNVLATEYNVRKPRACLSEETRDDAKSLFDVGLPREVSDVYRNRASDRQFVTQPVTENIPDTLAFRNYLYSNVVASGKK